MSTGKTSLRQARERHIGAMRLTDEVLSHIVRDLSDEKARESRDGPDGWSIIEILCHLRDFDAIFRSRAKMMLSEDHPSLPAYDHEAMAVERAYQQERLSSVCEQLKASRRETIAFFASLTPDQWERAGVHPERDSFTMTDAVMQVGLHDLDHLEQITRVLAHRSDARSGN